MYRSSMPTCGGFISDQFLLVVVILHSRFLCNVDHYRSFIYFFIFVIIKIVR